ncbi:hypothetical protein [Herbihabitans rhizosphaerae]|nr:hypothetical protein [Herbihabitans rhizosphaerae]
MIPLQVGDKILELHCGVPGQYGTRYIHERHPISAETQDMFAWCVAFAYGGPAAPGPVPNTTQHQWEYAPGKFAVSYYRNDTNLIVDAYTKGDGPQENNWVACAES